MFAFIRSLLSSQYPTSPPPTLLSLPPETRLNIFSHLFPRQTIYINKLTPTDPIHEPAILQTSRELRQEGLPIFYESIELNIPRPRRHAYSELYTFLSRIPNEKMLQIRRFVIPWTMRCVVTIQLSPNPNRKWMKDEGEMQSSAPNAVVVGQKYYVHIASSRPNINDEFCKEVAELMARLLDCLLVNQEKKGRLPGLYLTAVDLRWLICHIDLDVPPILKEVCDVNV